MMAVRCVIDTMNWSWINRMKKSETHGVGTGQLGLDGSAVS